MEIQRRQQVTFFKDLDGAEWAESFFPYFKPNYVAVKNVTYSSSAVIGKGLHMITCNFLKNVKNNILFTFHDSYYSESPNTMMEVDSNALSNFCLEAFDLGDVIDDFTGTGDLSFTLDFLLIREKVFYFDRFDILYDKMDKMIKLLKKDVEKPDIVVVPKAVSNEISESLDGKET